MNDVSSHQLVGQEVILTAARTIFRERGFEETTMEDIARAANYTRRTLYAYFQSREEICLLVFLEGLRLRWACQREAMAREATGLDQIRAWGEALGAYYREHPHHLRLQSYWDYKGIDQGRIRSQVFDEFRSVNEEIVAGLRAAFAAGERDGSLRPGLSVDLTIGHYALTLRSVLNKLLFPGYSFAPAEVEPSYRYFLNLFLRALTLHPDDALHPTPKRGNE
jgi:AcrR family transcriptional regulator